MNNNLNSKIILGREILINTSGQLLFKKRFIFRFKRQAYRFI
jgi:hypothetical protein